MAEEVAEYNCSQSALYTICRLAWTNYAGELMAKGASFLADADHVTQLTAGNNMPAGFVATFTTAKDGYDTQPMLYLNKATGQPVGTVTKIAANNAIYRKVMRLSKDAPLALAGLPSRYNQLAFAQLEAMVVGGNAPKFSKEYTVAAGSNLTLNEFVLTETMQLGVTLNTDVGPVYLCRNLLAGCAGAGRVLTFEQQLDVMAMELDGLDPHAMLTNTTAVDVVVLVKVLEE